MASEVEVRENAGREQEMKCTIQHLNRVALYIFVCCLYRYLQQLAYEYVESC